MCPFTGASPPSPKRPRGLLSCWTCVSLCSRNVRRTVSETGRIVVRKRERSGCSDANNRKPSRPMLAPLVRPSTPVQRRRRTVALGPLFAHTSPSSRLPRQRRRRSLRVLSRTTLTRLRTMSLMPLSAKLKVVVALVVVTRVPLFGLDCLDESPDGMLEY